MFPYHSTQEPPIVQHGILAEALLLSICAKHSNPGLLGVLGDWKAQTSSALHSAIIGAAFYCYFQLHRSSQVERRYCDTTP